MDYELKDIQKDIIGPSSEVPIVLDFWAEWCGPCRALSPVIEKLASQAKGKWKLVKVDVDKPENQQLAAQFQIRSIPAVRMLFQGRLLGHFDGALPEAEVKKWLVKHLPEMEDDGSEDEETPESALEAGDRARALEIAKRMYNDDRENDELKVQLALLLLPDDMATASKLMGSLKDAEKFIIEKEVLDVATRVEAIAAGKEKPAPADAKLAGKYTEACKDLMAGRYEDAASKFIEIIMVDRSLDDDGARKACVALFKILGDKHPVTTAYRRRFSMALY